MLAPSDFEAACVEKDDKKKRKAQLKQLWSALISCLWPKNLKEATGTSTVQVLEMTLPELWAVEELK